MFPKCHKPDLPFSVAKKPPKPFAVYCPNPACMKGFDKASKLQKHLAMSTHCGMYMSQLWFKQQLVTEAPTKTQEIVDDRKPSPFPQQEAASPFEEMESNEDDIVVQEDQDQNTDSSLSSSESVVMDSGPTPNQDHQQLVFTKAMVFETKLLKILDDIQAPHYVFQQIMDWSKEASLSKYNFKPQLKTRNAFINQLKRTIRFPPECEPKLIAVELDGPFPVTVDVTVFDFKSQLVSLLQQQNLFDNFNNLDVNPSNPFSKYIPPDGVLGTTNSGSRYNDAYNNMIKEPNDFLLPIIFACDETKLSSQSKLGCWPLMFTTSLLNQSQRNKPSSWRPLGYIFDLSIVLSNSQMNQLGPDVKYSYLHQIFRTILQSYIEAQTTTILHNMKVVLGDKCGIVNVKVPCFFIIGDMQGGDKICGCAPVYRREINRICRNCDVKGDQTGNPNVICHRLESRPIQMLIESKNYAALKQINQYCVDNAWFDVDFGGCPYGIFSAACPVEPLHSIENGLIADCLKVLFHEQIVSKKSLSELDVLVQNLCKMPRQHYVSSGGNKEMP